MFTNTQEALSFVRSVLKEAEIYGHASHVLNYDLETICPPKAMEEQGEVIAFLDNQAFKLTKQDRYIEACEYLYAHKDELDEFDQVLASALHRQYLKTKNITPEMSHRHGRILQKAYVDWVDARQKSDFSLFAPSLAAVRDVQVEQVSLSEEALPNVFDNLLANYERGVTRADLDKWFDACKKRLLPLLKEIQGSSKKIRTDFLSRPVTDDAQRKMSRWLLETIGFDFERGAFTTTEHPFTDGLGRNDIRVTTHYYPTMFYASMYSIIHEGGHALFDQLQPQENYDHFIDSEKTMAMHESVSRLYENRFGRSAAFVHLIYPKVKEIFPEVMADVSERELYEALNLVEPTLIRTEADEFTYTIHIIIRYEIEKMILDGTISIEELPAIWNQKYQEYLGITPDCDRNGILQDVHWSFGFGYFPTYALGNMFNAMYMNRLTKEIDLDAALASGDFATINGWMKDHVFKRADRLSSKEWIREITGRDFTPDDYLDYLEKKYRELYEL